MNDNKPVSKVLVLDHSHAHLGLIKEFCDNHNLIGLKVRHDRLFSVLQSNIDLGAILLSENYAGSLEESAGVALTISRIRPELPIIIRREVEPTTEDFPEALRNVLCGAYVANDMAPLKVLIDQYIFSIDYPNALIRGISEITVSMLGGLFKNISVSCGAPSIVRDRIIFGEVFSLIPLESAWCRGYMMMQTEEAPILELIDQHRMCEGTADFRDLNSALGELTNLIWGSLKNRYMGDATSLSVSRVQVPLLINHKQKYISFGSENPQLCFVYRLMNDRTGRHFDLHQRLIFSLSWSPEEFRDLDQGVNAMIEAGELDLF